MLSHALTTATLLVILLYSRDNLPRPLLHKGIEEMSLGTRLGTILVASICMSDEQWVQISMAILHIINCNN